MHRWVVLLSLAACAPGDREAPPEPPVAWRYPPPASGFPLGALRGRLGRSQAPEPLVELGIAGREAAGDALAGVRKVEPLRQASAWAIPGDGPARAVVYGSDGDRPAIELIELDAPRGRVAWRDDQRCAAPIVGATREAIVCADVHGTRAVGLDGALRWSVPSAFLAFTGDRVTVTADGGVAVLDAASGHERARVKLPRGVAADTVIASCDAQVFAATQDGKLVAARDGAIAWSVALGVVRGVDVGSCGEDEPVIAAVQLPQGLALVALVRGKPAGRIDGVLGRWPARTGAGLEVATARGVARYDRTLATGAPLALPPLGELIAARGDRRLVRATPLTAALLDRDGVRAYVAFAAIDGVLGDRALLATSWTGSPGETVHRFALPARVHRTLRLPARHPGVALDAELRDLPPLRPLALAGAATLADTATRGVAGYAIDPADGAALYAIALDRDHAAVARADLAGKRWLWQRTDGCATGQPLALAVARDVVVCATRGTPSIVRATSRDGAPRWQHVATGVDAIAAAGDAVVLYDADRLTVLDAGDGHVLARLASDDTAAMRAALVATPGATLLFTAEHGRVVARLARGLWPLWSVEVAGAVRALSASGDGVLVALEDGDAYRLDAQGAITALPGLGLAWYADGDVVAGTTRGGPIPGPTPPPAAPTAAQIFRRPLQILKVEIQTPPPMSTPIPPPPPLGDSWQLALFELTGGVRARNDYALPAPVSAPAPRGPAGSPLVIAYAAGEAIVLDPRTGDPLRRVQLPDDAAPGAVFGTIVDGSPVAGALLGAPLRVVPF